MAFKFGRIDYSETSFEEQIFHKNQALTSASLGVHQHYLIKDDKTDPDGVLSTSGSHWAFIHSMFYLSGSTKVNTDESDKFNSIYHNFNQYNDLKPHHNNKFNDVGSAFYIPQGYFGERIKPGSFQLTFRSGSAKNEDKQVVIVDDNNGNLYSSNAYESSSALTHLSSSDNYVGNVFYDLGIAVLTETGAWSGSVNYTDLGGNGVGTTPTEYIYWNLNINSTTPIFTSQYSIKIPSGEFNRTMNATTKKHTGDEIPSGSSLMDVANIKNELTGSGWSPYFNQIQLYENEIDEPVLIANLPRAVKMRDDIDLIITFRVDH